MIEFSKTMHSAIKSRTATKEELANYLITNLPATEIANELAEYILKENTVTPISVSQEEYERITSLFRIKGQRLVDGCYVAETRGRKAVTNKE